MRQYPCSLLVQAGALLHTKIPTSQYRNRCPAHHYLLFPYLFHSKTELILHSKMNPNTSTATYQILFGHGPRT